MSYGDSEAVFEQRALRIGLDEATFRLLKNKGFKTMALFAFSCNFSPASTSDKPFIDMLKDVLGRDASPVELSCFRRLFNESFANVAADIKSQVEQTDESTSRKLAPAERAERLQAQQKRLTRISIRGQYEPGDTLVDRCCACYESDRLVYIDWSSCISREYELCNNVKRDSNLTFTSDRLLKLQKHSKPDPIQSTTEIQIRYCLARRGLALEQANVLDFKLHDQLAELFMEIRMQDPPAGYQRVSLKQIELADKKFFALMAEETRSGIKANASGRPCDLCFPRVFQMAEFRHLLQPRMGNSLPTGVDQEPPVKKQRQDEKGRGKGRQKGDTFQRVPTDLLKLGGVATTSKGHRLCFGFSLKTCKLPVSNQKCDRGLHLCCIKGCFKNHPAVECPNKKKYE
ncbi:Uncharacterized protein SCF082_LOCUS7605 [Durusdinium trenchii]|uniref:Uncharacterized protein n=1 Tax=Durusdinium trenchii TaxID=1381693 RepID=A0ABP0IP88_9DINO